MIVVIEKPTDKSPVYDAWTADFNFGIIVGSGETIEEVKADFMNSVSEMKECFEKEGNNEALEYLKETPYFYLRID